MAVETLVENDLYEIAIDTLKRYQLLKEVSLDYLLLFFCSFLLQTVTGIFFSIFSQII